MGRKSLTTKIGGRVQRLSEAALENWREALVADLRSKKLPQASATMLRSLLAEINTEIERRSGAPSRRDFEFRYNENSPASLLTLLRFP
jgi:hypothetical protein